MAVAAFIQISPMESKGNLISKCKTCNHIIPGSHLSSSQKQNGRVGQGMVICAKNGDAIGKMFAVC